MVSESGTPKQRRPITEAERRAIAAIQPGRIHYEPGNARGCFAADLQRLTELTAPQRRFLWRIVWDCRDDIEDPGVVEMGRLETLEQERGSRCRRNSRRRR